MIQLHLGCGWRNFGPEWVHIDKGSYAHLDSKDIINLPYADNSVDLIYASHVFAYFDREEGLQVLKKWFLKLKKGGLLRISVTDFATIAKLYLAGQFPLESFLGPLFGKMQMGDATIYEKTVYDFAGLNQLLRTTGFSDVNYYDWKKTEHAQFDDHSKAHLPHDPEAIKTQNFTAKHTLISLNIEAKK